MLNAQEDVITDVRMSIEIMTYVLQMSKLQPPNGSWGIIQVRPYESAALFSDGPRAVGLVFGL